MIALLLPSWLEGLGDSSCRAEGGDESKEAVAVWSSAPGSNVGGIVTFTADSGGVKVVADVTGLTPGKHGFHIHEFGDCSDKAAKSASTGARSSSTP